MVENKVKEFGEYLKNKRKEKGLSIRKLEELSGVSNAYLSQLENGKRGMPSPEIIKKINGPLGVEYDELMEKAGYIDLHPETVSIIKNNDLNEVLTNAAEIFIKSVTGKDGEITADYRNNIIREIQREYSIGKSEVEEIVNDDFINKLVKNLTLEEKISFLNIMIKDFEERNIDAQGVFETSSICKNNTVKTLRVPVLGHIAAGLPITAEEHIDEWTEIPNMWNLKESEVIVLKVKGDSMIGSRIYEGDRVVVKLQSDVESGEIAVVNVNGDEATLKRVKKSQNGQVILYPDNPQYEPIFIAHEGARIIGKVIQVIFEPK